MARLCRSKCAEALLRCPPNSTLEESEASETFIVTTLSNADTSQAFPRTEYTSYDTFRKTMSGRPKGGSVIVSLSAHNSFSPLRITAEDLRSLVQDEDINTGFAALVASFGNPPRASELGYSCVSTTQEAGSYSKSYLLRFVEKVGKYWKLRQCGIYHRYNEADESHFWVLLHAHCPGDDALSKKLIECFSTSEGRSWFNSCPDSLHSLIFDIHMPNWRWYLDFLGESYTDLSHQIGTVELDSDFECGATLASLQKCKRLLEKMAAIPAMMDALDTIIATATEVQDENRSELLRASTSAHRRATADIKSSSNVLVRQTQGLVDLLGNTLDLKNQRDAARVNDHLLKLSIRTAKDSVVIRVITLVTLLYLPATFVATLFGMNFFDFEGQSRSIVISGDIWIYFVVLAGLTGITLMGWRIWTKIAAKDKSFRIAEVDDEKV